MARAAEIGTAGTCTSVERTVRWRADEENRFSYSDERGVMNHFLITAISDEMSGLLDQQSRLLKETSVGALSSEQLEVYAERDQRLRKLCHELINTE
jgi:hypothetical protein